MGQLPKFNTKNEDLIKLSKNWLFFCMKKKKKHFIILPPPKAMKVNSSLFFIQFRNNAYIQKPFDLIP